MKHILVRSLSFAVLLGGCASNGFAQSRIVSQREPSRDPIAKEEHDIYERGEFFRDRLLSNDVKDPDLIQQLSIAAWSGVTRTMSFKENATASWRTIGSGIAYNAGSGRVRSIAFDPLNPSGVYIAATVGGLWHTADIYADTVAWTSLTDQLPSSVVTQVVVPKQQPHTIYVGTGETYAGYTSPFGRGIYKSIDDGLTWVNVLSSERMGSTCSQLVVDETDPNVLYAAGPGSYYANSRHLDTTVAGGLFKTIDAGAHWSKLSTGDKVLPSSIAIDPVDHQRMYITGFWGEIMVSTDGGATWSKLNVPFNAAVFNPMIAIAPSAPNMLYVIAAGTVTRASAGIFSSSDFGATWTLANPTDVADGSSPQANFMRDQGEYGSTIIVDPLDSMSIYVGGIDVYSSNDGGQTLSQLSVWFDPSIYPTYTHADIHTLGLHDGILFSGNDGGVSYYSGDSGWHNNPNTTLPTLQFISADGDRAMTFLVAGAQDNGTSLTSVANPTWFETGGGDGGEVLVNEQDGSHVFRTYVYTSIYRSDDSGHFWGASDLVTNSDLISESAPFYAAYDASLDGNVVAFGGLQHVYLSQSGGDDGFPTQGTPAIGASYSMKISPRSLNNMWAGVQSAVCSSTDGGLTWIRNSLPAIGHVIGLALGENDSVVYAITSGLNLDSTKRFFVSHDGGATWSTPANIIPNIPFNSLARASYGALFIGTDQGVIVSTDGGVHWSALDQGMPRVQVMSLKVKGLNDQFLLAGTHGRGAYVLDLGQAGIAPSGITSAAALSFQLGEAFPNPSTFNAATERIVITSDGVRKACATLYDNDGRYIRTVLRSTLAKGEQIVTFDTRDLASGVYHLRVVSEGTAVVRSFSVLR
jgi:photosystem II stability/assembly factor-like uncharacterized protein